MATLASADPVIGTWVKTSDTADHGKASLGTTLTVTAGAVGGLNLTYHIKVADGNTVQLVVETKLDGSDAPSLVNGKPSGQTMAIKRVDQNHFVSVTKQKGKIAGRSRGEISADGKTLAVHNEIEGPAAGGAKQETDEVWTKQE